MRLVGWAKPQSPGGDCGKLLVIEGLSIVCRERTPSLMAHQGEVAGVVEELMDVSHVATQERALGRAVHESNEIQSDGTSQNGGKPSGSLFCAYGLLKHLNHLVPLIFSRCRILNCWAVFHRDYSPSGHSHYNLGIHFSVICLTIHQIRPTGHKKSPTGGVRRNHQYDSYPLPRRSASQAEGRSLAPGFYQLQWRDRAGLSPASLFSPERSGQPNGFSRLLTED